MQDLADALRQPNAGQTFPQLKQQVMEVLRQIQSSILLDPQIEKNVSLVIYNLSRYNDNPDFLPDALSLLLSQMDGEGAKTELVNNLQNYLDKVLLGPSREGNPQGETPGNLPPAREGMPQRENSGNLPPYLVAAQNLTRRLHQYFADSHTAGLFTPAGAGAFSAREAEHESKVIDTLAKIITKQAGNPDVQLLSGDRVDKIIESLLASPSNFTPLLHYIVPVEANGTRAFAEIWVDPVAEDEEPKKRKGKPGDNTHMLVVFEVEGIGRFESELYVQNKRIALNLLCPPAYLDEFKAVAPGIRQAVAATGYSFESINIDRLVRTHSLMEVFTDLPYRRMGIDVKI